MDAPLCRLCGHKHYGSEPHRFANTPMRSDGGEPDKKSARKKKPEKIKLAKGFYGSGGGPEGPNLVERFEELLARIESLEARVLQLESRKKYQAELMRKRRAEGKA